MLTNWIPPQTLAALNDGFVVAIMLAAKEGEADAVAEILEVLTPPTMAEPGVKLFLPYRSPTNPSHFFIFELYVQRSRLEGSRGDGSLQGRDPRALASAVAARTRSLRSVHRELTPPSAGHGRRLVARALPFSART